MEFLTDEMICSQEDFEYELVLCSNNNTPIIDLETVEDKTFNFKWLETSEMSFKVSKYIENPISLMMELNLAYSLIGEGKKVKVSNEYNEYMFVIDNIEDDEWADEYGENCIVHCYSLEHKLTKRNISLTGIERHLKKNDVDKTDGIFDIFERETKWKLRHLDEKAQYEFINGGKNEKYRWFDAFNKSWIDFLRNDVCNAYDIIIVFNTVDKTFDVYDRQSYGNDTQLVLSTEDFLKRIKKNTKSETMCTRLFVSGREGVEINAVNPLGTNYVENFDYAVSNGLVSDELKQALANYNFLLNTYQKTWQSYKDQAIEIEQKLNVKYAELKALQEEMKGLTHIQTAYIKTNDNTNLPTVKGQIDALNVKIASKNSEISALTTSLNDLNEKMKKISDDVDKTQAKDMNTGELIFNEDLLNELEEIIIEDYWGSSAHTNAYSLYVAGQEVLKDKSVPTTDVELEMVDVYSISEGRIHAKFLKLGDFITAVGKDGVNRKLRLVEIQHEPQSHNLKCIFTNKEKKVTDNRVISNALTKSKETTKVLDFYKFMWDSSKDNANWIDNFRNSYLDASANNVRSAYGKNKININENGIFVINADDDNQQISITSGMIAFTNDGWKTANTAIDNTGVYAKNLVGQIILGNNLYITNGNGEFNMTGDRITYKDKNGKIRLELGILDRENNIVGLRLFGKDGQTVILDENGIIQSFTDNGSDNVAVDYPLRVYLYVPPNALSVRQCKLHFRLENFRTHVRTVASGGGTTSNSGGGQTSSSSSISTSSADGGFSVSETSYQEAWTNPAGHLPVLFEDPTSWSTGYIAQSSFGHKHKFNVSVGNHSHGMAHTHTVSNHDHWCPNHSHDLEFGIFEGKRTTACAVWINDQWAGGDYSNDENELDIAKFLKVGQYNKIEFWARSIGRISYSMFTTYFLGV